MTQPIFVFGSNLEGRHGAGAAKYARQHRGAEYGVGAGPTGNAYAIPTKETPYKSLSLEQIAYNVNRFRDYAKANPDKTFELTPIGCGLGGYNVLDLAPLFKGMPDNVFLSRSWLDHLDGLAKKGRPDFDEKGEWG